MNKNEKFNKFCIFSENASNFQIDKSTFHYRHVDPCPYCLRPSVTTHCLNFHIFLIGSHGASTTYVSGWLGYMIHVTIECARRAAAHGVERDEEQMSWYDNCWFQCE